MGEFKLSSKMGLSETRPHFQYMFFPCDYFWGGELVLVHHGLAPSLHLFFGFIGFPDPVKPVKPAKPQAAASTILSRASQRASSGLNLPRHRNAGDGSGDGTMVKN